MRMKLLGFVMAVTMVLSLFSGCAGGAQKDSAELSLYYMSDDQKVESYIAAFNSVYPDIKINGRAFSDANQMDEIVTNELSAGKGPDIIIFDSSNSLDVLRLVKSGAFAALDERIEADSSLKEEDYLPGAFSVGKVDGKQYILPLTFNIPVVWYDETPELGLEGAPIITYSQFAAALDSNLARFEKEDNRGAIVYNSLFSPLIGSGEAIALTDNNRKVEYDDVKLEQTLSLMQKIYQETGKMQKIVANYGGDITSAAECFALLLQYSNDFIHETWVTNNIYVNLQAEKFRVSALSQNDDNEVTALLESFGMVTNHAGERAYDFLRIAMDVNPTSGKSATYGLSLNQEALRNQLEAHQTMTSNMKTKSGSIMMSGLSDQVADDLNSIIAGITEVKMPNSRVMGILADTFDPYFQEKKSYEDCLMEFKQKMNLYVTE